ALHHAGPERPGRRPRAAPPGPGGRPRALAALRALGRAAGQRVRSGEQSMIDLTTRYLGLTLGNPLVCSASPLCQDLDALRRMEEAGAAAVVLHSLFEEQIELEGNDLDRCLDAGSESYAEATSYFPDMANYNLGPDGYLEHIREAKSLLRIPVIASLNGRTRGGWVRYARLIEEAGADALELNVYELATDPLRTGAEVEDDLAALVADVCGEVRIPVAVKLSP